MWSNLSDHYWCLNVHWYPANKVTDTYNISGRCDQTEITNRRLFMMHSVELLGLSHVGLSLVKHTLLHIKIYGLNGKSDLATHRSPESQTLNIYYI